MNVGNYFNVIGHFNLSALNDPQVVFILIGAGLLMLLLVVLLFHMELRDKHGNLRASFDKLLNSFEELDEQARLIIKTDLELNKAQEELDKRLNGLDALQKVSRAISTTLDENEICQRLNQPLLTELGLERYLILLLNKDSHLQCRVNIGFSDDQLNMVLSLLRGDEALLTDLVQQQIISSARASEDQLKRFLKIFNVKYFVLTPILAQNKMLGIVFAGNQSEAFAVTEGDEELLSILADQIGQSLENARLFEQAYHASQELETKVEERTRQLTKAFEEMKKISQTKSEFISAVSHELRTPLTSIKGYASLLMTGKIGEIPEKVKDRLDKINKHSDNLVKLVNDLLDISRVESGRVEMKFQPHDIAALIENVKDLLTPQIKEKEIQFLSSVDAGAPAAPMDAGQIERVLINLVGNAVKFTPRNGTISVRAEYDEEKLIVSVTDTGIGIKEEDVEKLFNEFFRVENEINQTVKGTGLGLALAKKIVEAHGGTMSVSSTPNEGSTFMFTLPLEKTAGQKAASDPL